MKSLVALLLLASVAGAQAAPARPAADPNDPRPLLHGGLREVGTWVEKAADLVPADKYSYKPVGTVRTYGQLVAHIADGMNWYCANAAGKKTEWSDTVEKTKTDKASIVAELKKAHSACHTATNTGALKELMSNIGHTNLHYGNVITYMRMMGLTPPSS